MLDPFTLIIVLVLTHLFTTGIFGVVWYANRSIPGLGLWALGRVFITLALLVFAYRTVWHPAFAVVLSNAALFAGFYLIWQGNAAFMERKKTRWSTFAVFGVVYLGVIAYWTYAVPDFAVRSALIAVMTLAFDILSFRALWPRGDDEVYFSGKLLAVMFALNGGVQMVRVSMVLTGQGREGLLNPSLSTQTGLLTAIVMTMVTAMANMAVIMEYLKKDLKRQAERDPLTGAFNRRAFSAIAHHVLARARRDASPVSLVVLDLDHFKAVNDTHGHTAGDQVLRRVVELVYAMLREHDVLVRLGGEEFAILLPATTVAEARHVAERIRTAVERERFASAVGAFQITTSLGVGAMVPESAPSVIEELLDIADREMYRAKESGRNRVCVVGADRDAGG